MKDALSNTTTAGTGGENGNTNNPPGFSGFSAFGEGDKKNSYSESSRPF